jgi:hypothetical protein
MNHTHKYAVLFTHNITFTHFCISTTKEQVFPSIPAFIDRFYEEIEVLFAGVHPYKNVVTC